MRVAGPACGHAVAVAHDESGAVIVPCVACRTTHLPITVGGVSGNIAKIFRAGQSACDFLLHRHEAGRHSGAVVIGAVVSRVPEAKDTLERPGIAFQRPSKRSGLPAKEDRAAAIASATSSGKHNPMADGRHRKSSFKNWTTSVCKTSLSRYSRIPRARWPPGSSRPSKSSRRTCCQERGVSFPKISSGAHEHRLSA
jgi:hypothetical protein